MRASLRTFFYPAFTLFLCLGLFLLFAVSLRNRQRQERTIQASVQADLVSRAIEQALTELFVGTTELDIHLRTDGFSTARFPEWAAELQNRHRNLDVLQLAPNAVIRESIPLKGLESAIGANLLASKRRQVGVAEAIQNRRTNFIGPVRLAQNGEVCIIARRPVFTRDSAEGFWGFTIGIAYFRNIAQRELAALEGAFHYRLEGHDPDSPTGAVLTNSPGHRFSPEAAHVQVFTVPSGAWNLRLEPVRRRDWLLGALLGFGVVVSAFLAWLVSSWERSQARERAMLVLRNEALKAMAETDPLTGLLNRRAFLAQARHALEPPLPASGSKACLFIDIDHFKQVNDHFGHAAGDAALQAAAECIRQTIRKADLVARFGGEEFAVLVSSDSLDQARAVAEKVRGRVEDMEVPLPAGTLRLTVSLGVAQRIGAEAVEEMLRRADDALYQAKALGRNQVRCAGA